MARGKARRRRPGRGTASGRTRTWFLWGGLAVAVAVVIGVIVATQSGSGEAADFRIVAYQGQDVLGGEEVEFSRVFEHGKPVVLNFWAGLCPPCRQEMPGFQRVYDELGDQYVMVGVDVGPFVGLGSHDDALQFIERRNVVMNSVVKAQSLVWMLHEISLLP